MNDRRYVVEIMSDIVAAVSAELLPQLQAYDALIQAVNYQFGHPLEILETLKQRDESLTLRYKKYPLVALFTDIQEDKGVLGKYSSEELVLMVVYHTNPTYKAAERLARSFKPVIHPIVDSLIQHLSDNSYFLNGDPDLIVRKETDHYFWGRQGSAGKESNVSNLSNISNIANDYLDATELRIQLDVNPSCIITPLNTNIR